ncbi:MAG: protein kinase, partial [Verrucomicrobiales bacterium]|nr:protein kinase [Verrucomicrobiales bacterium]
MTPPEILDYSLGELIGEGSTGLVWSASHQGKDGFAVKTFKGLAINRQLLSDALVRIYNGPQHPGIAKICDFDMASPQAYVTTELLAEEVRLANGQTLLRTNSMESLCGNINSDKAWAIAILMADAMAFLHRNRIAHCNLKPSNVLFENMEPTRPQLVDFTQGMLGGIEQIEPGDSLFYSSPEQLRNPDHFIEGSAQSWDVYSFGATVYRLITGNFPRLNKDIVAFLKRNKSELSIRARIDRQQLANSLENETEISWDAPQNSRLEGNYRKIIEKCLKLDPRERYVDMREVFETFRSCRIKSNHAATIARLEGKVEKLNTKTRNSRKRSVLLAAGIAAAITACAIDIFFRIQSAPLPPNPVDPSPASAQAPEITTPTLQPSPIETKPAITEGDLAEALAAIKTQLADTSDNFQHSQAALDALFSMISARDGEGNALYSIPNGTLGTLLNYYDDFAGRHSGDIELRAPVASALNNGGELSLLLGDYPAAIEKLDKALNLLGNVETGGNEEGSNRAQKARIHLNLSQAKAAQGLAQAACAEALQAKTIHRQLSGENPESIARTRLLAASSLQLARKLVAANQPDKALPHAEECSALIGKLEEENAANEADLSLLASAAFATGRIHRLRKQNEDAIKFQINAIDRYLELVSSRPEVTDYRFQLARAYGEAADLAALLAETAESTEANSESSSILRELAEANPESAPYRFELARRLRMNAQLLRVAGSAQSALNEQQDAIILLEDLARKHPHIPVYRFELANLRGDQADIHGSSGKHTEAMQTGKQAVDLMQALLTGDLDVEAGKAKRPKYRRTLAGLYARLGYHAQNAGDVSEARHCIEKSRRHYQGLLEANPEDAHAIEGNKWAEESLKILPNPADDDPAQSDPPNKSDATPEKTQPTESQD